MKSKRRSLHINNLVALHNSVLHSLENKKEIFIQKINLVENLHKPYMRSYHHVSFFYQLKSNCIIQRLIQIVNVLHRNHMPDLWRVAEEKKPGAKKSRNNFNLLNWFRIFQQGIFQHAFHHWNLVINYKWYQKISSHDWPERITEITNLSNTKETVCEARFSSKDSLSNRSS